MTEKTPLAIPGMNINYAINQSAQELAEKRSEKNTILFNENEKIAKKIITKFKPIVTDQTKITIFEKPKNPQQSDIQIDLTSFQISDSEISFLRSDNSKNRISMEFVPFCLVTKLGIKNENGLLEENLKIYPTSTKLHQTS